MNYREYIISKEWRQKHKAWLVRSHYRCSMFPWLSLKKAYNIHHMNYRNLGQEKLYRDVIPLSKFAHSFVIHGILSGFKRPSQQTKYPNKAQQIAHAWCCVPVWVRFSVVICFAIGYLASFAIAVLIELQS